MEQIFPMTSRCCRHSLLAVLTPLLLLCGCGSQTSAEKLVGHWQGTSVGGSLSTESDWQFNADGTDTSSLTLPQGALVAQGTWNLHARTLTQTTTSRSIVVGGQPRKIRLLNPMEAKYQCVLTGDTLRLTQPETHVAVVLTRDTK